MDELHKQIAFLEARLTLLERKFTGAEPDSTAVPELLPMGALIQVACDQPGVVISQKYPNEYDELNRKFCWIGGDGPIQIILPIAPAQPLQCRLRIQPHPRVNMGAMQLISNDRKTDYSMSPMEDVVDVSFKVPASAARQIDILLADLKSVRPADFGENDDGRLLAARFFGAELVAV